MDIMKVAKFLLIFCGIQFASCKKKPDDFNEEQWKLGRQQFLYMYEVACTELENPKVLPVKPTTCKPSVKELEEMPFDAEFLIRFFHNHIFWDYFKFRCNQGINDATSSIAWQELEEEPFVKYPGKTMIHCLLALVRQGSPWVGKSIRNKFVEENLHLSPIYEGMEKTRVAYNMICDKELIASLKCLNFTETIRTVKMNTSSFLFQPDMIKKHWGEYLRTEGAFSNIPEEYKLSCDRFLDDSDLEASDQLVPELNETHTQYPYRSFVNCLFNLLKERSMRYFRQVDKSYLNLGVDMINRALQLIKDTEQKCAKVKDFEKPNPEEIYPGELREYANKLYLGAPWFKDYFCLQDYGNRCKEFLKEPLKLPVNNESDIMQDGNADYPYKAFVYCVAAVSKCSSSKLSESDRKLMLSGREMTANAMNKACEFATSTCERYVGNCEVIRKKLIISENEATNLCVAQFRDDVLSVSRITRLRDQYRHCEEYLNATDAEIPFEKDSGLNDTGKSYAFKAFTHCVMHTFNRRSSGIQVPKVTLIHHGMEMVVKAFEIVCEYEKIPTLCDGRQRVTMKNILSDFEDKGPCIQLNEFRENLYKNEQVAYNNFWGDWSVTGGSPPFFPQQYRDNCMLFVDNMFAKPDFDEEKHLNEAEGFGPYPLQALANCMVHTMRIRQESGK